MQDNDFFPGDTPDYDDIIEKCRAMARERIAEILKANAPFIGSEQGRLLAEEELYGVLLQMLSLVRSNMRLARKQKQRQGIEAAKAAGVQLGRRRKYEPEKYLDIYRQLENGDISINTALSSIGACRTTFDKMRRELRERGLL